MTDELKEFVLNGASAAEIKREAIRGGMVTLRRSALNKLAKKASRRSERGLPGLDRRTRSSRGRNPPS